MLLYVPENCHGIYKVNADYGRSLYFSVDNNWTCLW